MRPRRGRAPTATDAQLSELSRITLDDVDDAAATFRRDAPAGMRSLLDARPEPDSLKPPAGPVDP